MAWGTTVQERKDYIKRAGRTGLKAEFESDPEFKATVCPLIHQIGDAELKTQFLNEVSPFVDGWFGAPIIGEAEIVIGAAADACGYQMIGEKLIKAGAVALLAVVAMALITSYGHK